MHTHMKIDSLEYISSNYLVKLISARVFVFRKLILLFLMKNILNQTFFFFSSDRLFVFKIGMLLWKIELTW